MVERFAIYGADGFGREVLQLLKRKHGPEVDVVFLDDDLSKGGLALDGVEVTSLNKMAGNRLVCIAVADPKVRREISIKCEATGIQFGNTVASTAVVSDVAKISEGAVLCEFVNITANSVIGRHFHANIYSYVAHDCIVGDFVTFAPRVSCNGRVIVEDNVYIGTSAVLRQGRSDKPLVIGKGAVIGMGAVVTKDVPPGVTVVGNPARAMER